MLCRMYVWHERDKREGGGYSAVVRARKKEKRGIHYECLSQVLGARVSYHSWVSCRGVKGKTSNGIADMTLRMLNSRD